MKSGFAGDEATLSAGGKDHSTKAEVDRLYASLSTKERGHLHHGFGKDIATLFVPADLSEEMRREDGQEPEMATLIRRIVRWL